MTAPVGADASVRPADRTCKNECTNAKTYNVCRGQCRTLPARGTTVFTIRRGRVAVAPGADRVVRPYRALCGVADRTCNFAIAHCRGDVGIAPYGDFAKSPFVVRFQSCVLRGRVEPRPYGKWANLLYPIILATQSAFAVFSAAQRRAAASSSVAETLTAPCPPSRQTGHCASAFSMPR